MPAATRRRYVVEKDHHLVREGGVVLGFYTEALKALGSRRHCGVEVLAHCVQLGEAIEGKEDGQNCREENKPDYPFLASCVHLTPTSTKPNV